MTDEHRIVVPRRMAIDLRGFANSTPDREVVALLGFSVDTGNPVSMVAMPNRAPDPEVSFLVPPSDLKKAARALVGRGHTIGGVFHSHPHDAAYPSSTDIGWMGDDLMLLIAGKEEGDGQYEWTLRAWRGMTQHEIILGDGVAV